MSSNAYFLLSLLPLTLHRALSITSFDCAYSTHRQFRDPEDCHSYYFCVEVRVRTWALVHNSCPSGERWDANTESCEPGPCQDEVRDRENFDSEEVRPQDPLASKKSSRLTSRAFQNEPPSRPCIPRDFRKGSVVCVCNSSYCDTVTLSILSKNPGTVQVFTSSKSGSRLHKTTVRFNNNQNNVYGRAELLSPSDKIKYKKGGGFFDGIHIPILDLFGPKASDKPKKLRISRNVKYQTVIGYGGAFTDAAGINIVSLSQPAQENLMRAYFGPEGIDYSMGRVAMGGTDFSTRAYTYNDDVKGLGGKDLNLDRFALQPEDFRLKLPIIKWAQSLSKYNLKILASPWSAPAWMKTTKRLHGTGILKEEYSQTWADYFVKFIRSYRDQGVDIWGITTGNEPTNGFIPFWPFNCMGWMPAMMRRFIAGYLGPTLKAAKLSPRVIMLDDNKNSVATWAKEILTRRDSAQYVHGVGTHWYLNFLVSGDTLTKFHERYPDQLIIQTEACLGFTPWELEKVSLGNWERGEKYLQALIRDSESFYGAWIDWNLALDLGGGPNWAGLRSDAAILVDSKADEFLKQPIYYAMGHFTKFVPPDSRRVKLSWDSSSPKDFLAVAFLRPDNGVVVIFLNKATNDAKIALRDDEKGTIYINIPRETFLTLVYW